LSGCCPRFTVRWVEKSVAGMAEGYYRDKHLARLYLSLSQVQEAEHALRRAAQAAPSEARAAEANVELADVLIRLHRGDEALALLEPLAADARWRALAPRINALLEKAKNNAEGDP